MGYAVIGGALRAEKLELDTLPFTLRNMNPPPVSLATIAAAAGVSRMTVSRALRGHPEIALATRRRIVRLAEKLGHAPDPRLAEAMARLRLTRLTQAREVIAHVTAFPTPDGWKTTGTIPRIQTGARERARALGYDLQEFWASAPELTPRRLSDILRARGIRGVLVAPGPAADFRLGLRWDYFAAVTVGFSLSERLSRTSSHQWQAMRVALRELAALGYRRMGVALAGSLDARVDHLWQGAVLLHSQLHGGTVPPLIGAEWGRDILQAWLDREQPDVVIGSGQVWEWLQQLGCRVPGDVGFACINTDEVPAVAGVEHHSSSLGAAAIDLIVEQLHTNQRGLPARPKVVTIDCSWRPGSSVRTRRRRAAVT
jgi:LacI family transcriptional regulator